ncbi:MAG: hypothetical protein MR687_00015 [Spirochaetales bacterium]|nr:hypothetical protein [Spirochaetales bacterium]
MKKLIVLAFCVLFFVSGIFAEDVVTPKKNHIALSTGIFTTKIEYTRDISRWEIGGGIESGFPNLFIEAMVSNPDNVLKNLKDSITLFAAVNAYGSFDLIPSERHDLDLGINIQGLYLNLFENNVLGTILYGKVRYAFNFSKGGRIFIEAQVPTVSYSYNIDSNEGGFSYITSGEGLLPLVGLFGTKIGYAFAF